MDAMNIELRSGLEYRDEIKTLFDEYTEMLVNTNETFAEYLKIQKYDDEVEHLDHKYGGPKGRLYIAFLEGKPAGCIGLRDMGDGNCEMKRLYVKPDARHAGIGRILVDRIIGDAGKIGYGYMYLDTLPELETAIKMYLERGFEIIEKYNDSPVDTTIYMRKKLNTIKERPVIGLVPLWDEEKESYWMLPGYMKAVEKCGGIPIMLPLTDDEDAIEQLLNVLDGILLTGGQDVGPELYGEKPMDGIIFACPERDSMEWKLLTGAIKRNIPVFGICRGLQFINVFFGGTLYQDIPTQLPSDVEHHQTGKYDEASHEDRLTEGSPLKELLGADTLPVNSYHHQGIKDLADELEAMAVSDDGLVEAVAHRTYPFLWAVQWHPEFSYISDANSLRIIDRFVREAGRFRTSRDT